MFLLLDPLVFFIPKREVFLGNEGALGSANGRRGTREPFGNTFNLGMFA